MSASSFLVLHKQASGGEIAGTMGMALYIALSRPPDLSMVSKKIGHRCHKGQGERMWKIGWQLKSRDESSPQREQVSEIMKCKQFSLILSA